MNKEQYTQKQEKTQDILWEDFKKLLTPNHPLMGIDYGNVRIGIALSDTEWNLAYPFKIISKISELDDIVTSKKVCGFVIGMPYQPDGTEGKIAQNVRLFATRLQEKFNLPIYFIDERHSSKREETQMNAIGIRPKKIKKTLDACVARDLLQNILNKINPLSS